MPNQRESADSGRDDHAKAARPAGPAAATPGERSVREGILAAAAALYSRRGYHAVGIRELAEAVGLSTSTIYHYYSTKQDILYEIVSRFLAEFSDRLVSGLRDTALPPRLRLERAVTEHVVLTVTRREELLVGNPVLNALEPAQRARIAGLRRAYRDAVRDVIAEGAASGEFLVTDPLLTAMAMLDMLDGVRSWYHADGQLSLEELAGHYRAYALALCQAGDPT
jgi:AcrR family transcriptional regulator